MIIQSKCGICKGYYDLSKEHIIKQVEESIRLLNCDYLDKHYWMLLCHDRRDFTLFNIIAATTVDSIITGGQEEFDERFIVAEFPSTPDSIIKIVKSLFYHLLKLICP